MKRSFIYAVLLVIALALVALNTYLWQVQKRKKSLIEGLQSQIALHVRENESLLDRNNDLRVEVDTLRSPESYYSYEEKAREDYGLIGENEIFFPLSDADVAYLDDVPGLADETLEEKSAPIIPPQENIQLESQTQVVPEQSIEQIQVTPIPPLQLESLSGE